MWHAGEGGDGREPRLDPLDPALCRRNDEVSFDEVERILI